MPTSFESVTAPPFAPRLPAKWYELAFKTLFSGSSAAARAFKVSRMTIWRWRHDRAPLPRWAAELLAQLLQDKLGDLMQAQQQLRYYLDRPLPPPRPLTGVCRGRCRKPKKVPTTPEEWAALEAEHERTRPWSGPTFPFR